MSSADTSVAVKNLKVGQKLILTNGDEKETYEITEKNDKAVNAPEYHLKNVETGLEHGPVFWQWLDRDDLEFVK